MEYINYFLFLLTLFFPTFVSNASPILIKNIFFIKKFNKPISKKYFWKNKTYRWFISWILFAIIFSLLIFIFLKKFNLSEINSLYYSIITDYELAILSWILQWFWALFGDLIESFVKRKIWKAPWEAWPFWDWVDYIIWSLILFSIIFIPNIYWIIFLILFAPFISLIANIISYLIWWKNVWY